MKCKLGQTAREVRRELEWYARDTLKKLRRKVKCRRPCVLKFESLKDCFAICHLRKRPGDRRVFEITLDIDKMGSWSETVDTVCHEYAHALTWFDLPQDDHGALWGVAYAMCFCAAWGVK